MDFFFVALFGINFTYLFEFFSFYRYDTRFSAHVGSSRFTILRFEENKYKTLPGTCSNLYFTKDINLCEIHSILRKMKIQTCVK